MPRPGPRAILTLRIDPSLHRSLAAVSSAGGVSMNSIAEAALQREVALRAADLADEFDRAALAMRDHARPRLADLVDEIAADETRSPEPLPTTRTSTAPAPTFGAIIARADRLG